MSSSRPDTAATNRDVDSEENPWKFTHAVEATTYDDLLLDGRISNADVRDCEVCSSALHWISRNKDSNIDTIVKKFQRHVVYIYIYIYIYIHTIVSEYNTIEENKKKHLFI